MKRGAGILLPIFSLPSKYGIGTFGSKAKEFVRFLNKSNVKYWQILPLNPTSYGDSPYQSFSAFALNPYFIDLDTLIKKGYLTKADVKELDKPYTEWVEYGFQYETRFPILKKAYLNAYKDKAVVAEVEKFAKENESWVNDYAAFMVIKYLNNGSSYQDWQDDALRKHDNAAVAKVVKDNLSDYNFWIFLQYEAFNQYVELKEYANKKGVSIVGDIPIYVALDSADVWANPQEFCLDDDLRPTLVAGVPPDYFSADGQLWGNPLYNYNHMKEDGFSWWIKRVSHCQKLYDLLRIDHFRGMASYYTIPFGSPNARIGQWVEGPKMDLVRAIQKGANGMEIIAEDLGFLTDDVVELKKESGWPGLKIFEFGFDGADYNNEHLPRFWTKDCVAYIGTHDNDTMCGYIDSHRDLIPFMKSILNVQNDEEIPDAIIRNLFVSEPELVLCTMQDLLKQDTYHRINTPGTLGTNWKVRLPKDYASETVIEQLKGLIAESNR